MLLGWPALSQAVRKWLHLISTAFEKPGLVTDIADGLHSALILED